MKTFLFTAAILASSCAIFVVAEEWKCTWVVGRARGAQVEIADLTGADCIRKCYSMTGVIAVTEYQDTSQTGCWCMTTVDSVDDDQYDFHTCQLSKFNPSADLSYPTFKNKECEDYFFFQQGCYASTKGRLLVFYRWDIEWNFMRLPMFAHSLVCACANAAKAAGVAQFATHFWGECWEIKEADLGPKSADCVLADGLYKNKCNPISGECLGVVGFGVYKWSYHGSIAKKDQLTSS